MSDIHQDKLYWPIEKLHAWEKNPRDISSEELQRLKEQIIKLGQYKPLIITDEGEVLGGNMRLKAMLAVRSGETSTDKELLKKTPTLFSSVWVSVVNAKNDRDKLEYALSDNDRSGFYVEEQLNSLLKSFGDNFDFGNLTSYKIDMGEATSLESILTELRTPEEKGEPEEANENQEVISKVGEIYELGKHRLLCGDSLDVALIQKLLDGKIAELTFTDPPYNVGLDYNDYQDKLSSTDYLQFSKDWFAVAQTFSAKQIVFVGNINNKMWIQNFNPDYTCIWDKNDGATTHGYITQYTVWEPIFFHGKFERTRHSDMFRFAAGGDKVEHACPKPTDLLVEILANYTTKGATVLDLFGGSGSTLIACEQTGRICYMSELDPRYCDVIRRRYAKLIGQEALWQEVTPKI